MNEMSNLQNVTVRISRKSARASVLIHALATTLSTPPAATAFVFPEDVQALIRSTAEHIGYQPKLLQAVEQVNYQQKYKLPAFIQRH